MGCVAGNDLLNEGGGEHGGGADQAARLPGGGGGGGWGGCGKGVRGISFYLTWGLWFVQGSNVRLYFGVVMPQGPMTLYQAGV